MLLFFSASNMEKIKRKRSLQIRHLLKRLSPNQIIFKSILKVLVLCLAFACLSIALVNPKIGTKLETVKRARCRYCFCGRCF